MNKFWVFVVAIAGGALGALGACGDSACDTLAEKCATCPTPVLKTVCELKATNPNSTDEQCQESLDSGEFSSCG